MCWSCFTAIVNEPTVPTAVSVVKTVVDGQKSPQFGSVKLIEKKPSMAIPADPSWLPLSTIVKEPSPPSHSPESLQIWPVPQHPPSQQVSFGPHAPPVLQQMS